MKNLQGDIIGILDSDGNQVVEYVYETWGQQSGAYGSMAATLGEINPFRYRGYYYDIETGFYYLNSRYYDPETCRFLNADGYVTTGQGLIATNMFAYCGNNPIMRSNSSGHFWEELWQTFTQAINQTKEVFALAGAITQLDSPVPGPADVVGEIIAVGTLIYCGAVAVSQVGSASIARTDTRTQEKEKEGTRSNRSNDTVIYRWGSGSNTNLAPRTQDAFGLSFSTVPPVGKKYVTTTISAVNKTGILMAVQDSPTHVSVMPTAAGTMADWIASRPNAETDPHLYTITLKSICWDED